MKKLSELMDELGFDPEGSPAAKEAFIKYLIKSCQGVSVQTPSERQMILANPHQIKTLPQGPREEQLSFGFENETSTRSSFSLKRQKI